MNEENQKEWQNLLNQRVPQIRELSQASADAYWKVATTGSKQEEERFTRLHADLLKLFADRETFAKLKNWKSSQTATDPLRARQLELLYYDYAAQQIDEKDIDDMVARETEIESLFTTFRATIDGEKVSDNTILDILEEETDSAKRQAAWEASKQIGAQVADRLIDLVKLRNRIAKEQGYANYYSMQLELQEIDEQELFALLTHLSKATAAPFAAMKAEMDQELAARFDIEPTEMRPWHYADPFFQEAPTSTALDLNRFFADQDVVALAKTFYSSIGLEIQDILDNSDLYEREGKNQHAFCTDIDHSGDVRILCNVRPNEYWAATMLHELGHGVYDKYNDPELPWLLRQCAHTLTTEAIAMLFGRLTKDVDWMQKIAGVAAAEAEALAPVIARQLTRAMLIFVRWGLVMTHFERAMYNDPEQDLNTLWWDTVEQFQLIRRPEGRTQPDWAAKIHLGTAPVYYQNYILGELTASQLLAAMERDLHITTLTGHKEVGEWLKQNVFHPGARYAWNELLEKATGEKLSAEHFVKQFVGEKAGE